MTEPWSCGWSRASDALLNLNSWAVRWSLSPNFRLRGFSDVVPYLRASLQWVQDALARGMGKEQAMVEQHAADTLQPFLDRLREARTAVANGDPEPMKALCSHSDDVSQCGFWGGVESGWAQVGERWDWVAAQFVPGPGNVTSDTAFLTATGDMAYGVFIERWWGQLASRSEPTEIMIRATLIFRREDGVWKAVHRHGDNAVAKAPPS